MSRYIDADKLMELYEIDFSKITNATTNTAWNVPLNVVKQNIIDQPTADVRENVRGEWIDNKHQQTLMEKFINQGQNWKVCSICGCGMCIGEKLKTDKYYHEHFHNFCPNCGADMRGDNNE